MMLPPFIRRQLLWPPCLPVFLSLYAASWASVLTIELSRVAYLEFYVRFPSPHKLKFRLQLALNETIWQSMYSLYI